MDFHTFKRRDLQALCKLNNIPANITNAAMADALALLPTVEGLEEILGNLDSEAQGSPERSVLTSPNAPRTTTRRKAVNQELECSKLATKTSCRTRTKAVDGLDTRKTPATRTTRKRASQEASVQKNMEKDLQAEFEADMKQTEVPGNELQEISEEVSGVSEEVQSEVQNEVDGGQEVIELGDDEKSKEDDVVNELQDEEASEKVDFHSLNRKVLQNLCKKNKIPANMTNAAMADALDSLEIVEGLQEFVLDCDSQVPSSPLISGITSSCARRSRTTMRSTKEEPRSSKMITKSCRGSRRRIIEEVEQGKTDVPETPTAPVSSALYEIEEKEDSAVQKSEPGKLENDSSIEASEVSGVAEFNSDISNSLMQEASVIEAIEEDDNEKDDNGLLNVENLKGPEEIVPQVDEKVVEEEVLESSEVSEEVKTGTAGCELESVEVQHSSNLVIGANSESEDLNAEDQITEEYISCFATQADQSVTITSDSAAHMSPVEVEGGDAEGDVSEKSDTESATQTDKVSLENNVGSESEASYTEDEMSENSDCEATAQDDQPNLENNVESESEGSCTEDDEMSELSDSEVTAQNHQPSLENNVESDSEEEEMSENSDSEVPAQDDQPSLEIDVEKLENLDTTTDSAADAHCVEKPEHGHTEDIFSNMFDTESTIQAKPYAPTPKDYNQTSLRKLKQILKERLQANTLAKKMDNLTLQETEVPLAKVEEVQECFVESENALIAELSGNDDKAPVLVTQTVTQDTVNDDDIGESEEDTNDETATLHPVDVLLDNEVIPVDAIIGNIDVATCPPQATPSKCCSSMTKKPLLITPKSSSKTPLSAGRKSVLVDNKENIDNSVTKTEPGKIKIAVNESLNILSPLSMAMLKKDFKLQSEKKKQALQQRSENHCPLTSP